MAWPAVVSAISGVAGGIMDPLERYYYKRTDYSNSRSLMYLEQLYNQLNMAIQQKYAERNAELEYGYNSALQAQSACQQRGLAGYQNDLSKELNDYNAARDYRNQVNYIRDSVAAYKSALLANGYNPMLALQSSIPSYGGGAHSAVASGASVGTPSVKVGLPQAHSPRATALSSVSGLGGFGSASRHIANLAEMSSRISANEASATKDKALATEALERAKTEANHRTDTGHKIQSDTARNYGSIASSVATGIGTAYGAKKVADKVKDVVHLAKSGRPVTDSSIKPVAEKVIERGSNSAYLGSRLLQTVLPLSLMGAAGVGAGMAIEKANSKRSLSERFARPNPFRGTGFGL